LSKPPWKPALEARAATSVAAEVPTGFLPRRDPTAVTMRARTLHASAARRIWSTLLDYRDWVTYVYVPIIVPILVLAPYVAMEWYERSQQINQIVESLAQESRDLEQMTRLLDGPVPLFIGERSETLPQYLTPELKGFLILQDLRIIDLRRWNQAAGGIEAPDSSVYGYRRMKVRKETKNGSNDFRISLLATSPDTRVRFPPQQLQPKLLFSTLTGTVRHWEVGADFRKVPAGESVDIIYEHSSPPGSFLREGIESATLTFEVEAETIELSRWLLLPEGREYRTFQLIRYPTGRPGALESVEPVTRFLAEDFTILAFKLLALQAGYTYELTWFYR
jgi:hypothetical protein